MWRFASAFRGSHSNRTRLVYRQLSSSARDLPHASSAGAVVSARAWLEPVFLLDDLPVGVLVEDLVAAELIDVAPVVVECFAVRGLGRGSGLAFLHCSGTSPRRSTIYRGRMSDCKT